MITLVSDNTDDAVRVDPGNMLLTRELRENAAARAWLHSPPTTDAQRDELRGIVREQLRMLARDIPPDCACCQVPATRGFRGLYRCYQCDLWLCPACAREHFPGVVRLPLHHVSPETP